MDTLYEIPESRIQLFQDRFAALVKRAKKLGCELPTFAIGELAERKIVERDLDGSEWVSVVRYFPVTVAGEAPKFAGWTFVAVCDYSDGAEPIIRQCSPGEDLPKRYRKLGRKCEHCKLSRERKEVFVVRHNDGRTLQVGRQCIRDFLGHNSPESIAAAAELVAELHDVGSMAPDSEFGLAGAPREPALEDYLAFVARTIRLWGWKSRSAAYAAGTEDDTASAAWEQWVAVIDAAKLRRDTKKLVPTDEDRARAKACAEWGRAIPAAKATDYMHNLRAVCGRGFVSFKNRGIAASAMPAFDREMANRQGTKSEHVGKVGERLRDLLVRVIKTIELEPNEYGPRELVKMRDNEGRSLLWFTAPRSVTVGREYLLTGTVKKHGEREGVKETMLTRCDLREVGAPTAADLRAIEKASAVLYSVLWDAQRAEVVTEDERMAFCSRVRKAADEQDAATLEALRVELIAMLPVTSDLRATLEPKRTRTRKTAATPAMAA